MRTARPASAAATFYVQGVRQVDAPMGPEVIGNISAHYQALAASVPLHAICSEVVLGTYLIRAGRGTLVITTKNSKNGSEMSDCRT
jgi:hypothetical protein